MKKFKIFLLCFIILVAFQSCEKKSLIEDESINNGVDMELYGPEGSITERYFLNGVQIAKSEIDFDNNQLILLHGVLENKYDVMVFENRDDFYNWSVTKNDANIDQLVQGIKDADAARQYAIETGEINNEEPSEAFIQYLKDNYSSGSKIGVGKLYEDYDRKGWYFLMGSIPIPKLKDEHNNAASSIEVLARWYVLYNNYWWSGWLDVYGSAIWDSWNFTTANDKTSSVWTI